jgi:YebC/PmpR family DNA-binding regulatory protein
MTKDTIERAVKRGVGSDEEGNLDELTYEGYAPGGVAVLVEVMTYNRNRTVAEVRHAFSKHGGNLGTDGSVAYLFSKRGEFLFEPGQVDEEVLMELALESGADDVIANDDESFEVVCSPDAFSGLREAFKGADISWANAEVTMAPSLKVELDTETTVSVLKMLDRLEELDDVQNVYSNAVFDDDGLAAMD